jgi:hypothetical protein
VILTSDGIGLIFATIYSSRVVEGIGYRDTAFYSTGAAFRGDVEIADWTVSGFFISEMQIIVAVVGEHDFDIEDSMRSLRALNQASPPLILDAGLDCSVSH